MFKLPQELKDDIEQYAKDLQAYLSGETNPQKFRALRVPRGIYGQRKEKLFMIRVRVVAGKVYVEQLEKLAYVAREYGREILHVTTRQDIQIHHVKIEDTLPALRALAEVELSPRGGGGNTVRNIINCPLSGICPKEIFDTSAYVLALTTYLLKNPRNYNLPRKFKIVFDGCGEGCALSRVNDLGFAASKNNGREGFKVFCGGGMGLHSAVGFCLEEFIPVEDAVYITEAVIRTFDKYAERKNRHKARLRFLVEKIGRENFLKRYKEELSQARKERVKPLELIPEADAPRKKDKLENGDVLETEEYKRWRNDNVAAHRQPGYYYVNIRLELGDITSGVLEGLCALLKGFNIEQIRTTAFQNIIIPYLEDKELSRIYLKLKGLRLTDGRSERVEDVISCAGASTCNLGICNSRGLAGAIEKMIHKEGFHERKIVSELNIKISGCPNSCGQHPIGKISFYGSSRRFDNHQVPFYRLLLGAKINVEGAVLARECAFIPAKNVPDLLKDFLKACLANIHPGEDFCAYLERRGYNDAVSLALKYEKVPAYAQNKDYYIDWGKDEDFSLAGIGSGECGAGVLDMIEADLADADRELKAAKNSLEASRLNSTAKELARALSFASKSLLITYGIEPRNDIEAFKHFRDKFLAGKIISEKFSDITEKAWELNSAGLDEGRLKEFYIYARELLNEVKEAYKNMDSAFKFSPRQSVVEPLDKDSAGHLILNLRGVRCPMNYVQAKLYLENIKAGQIVEICLDEGEPIQNVPLSLKNDGQEIVEIKRADGYYKVSVKKLVDI